MKAVGVTVHYGLYQWYTILTLPPSRNNLQGSKWSSDGAQLNDDTNGPRHAHLLGFVLARTYLSYIPFMSGNGIPLFFSRWYVPLFICVYICIIMQY